MKKLALLAFMILFAFAAVYFYTTFSTLDYVTTVEVRPGKAGISWVDEVAIPPPVLMNDLGVEDTTVHLSGGRLSDTLKFPVYYLADNGTDALQVIADTLI